MAQKLGVDAVLKVGADGTASDPAMQARLKIEVPGPEAGGQAMTEDPEIERNVRRTVGIAALRRIRRIVDADNARKPTSGAGPDACRSSSCWPRCSLWRGS
jgi:hypothetical protein